MITASRPCSASASASEVMLPTLLAIFSPPIWSIPLCIQMRESSAPRAAARLRRLVLVVGEGQVVAAGVDLEADAEHLLGHRRALDVPARAPAAPGRVPGGVLALLLGLPEREVERILLAIGAFDPLALVHVVDRAMAQRAVVGVRAHAEVDVAVDRVGRAVVEQGLDQVLDRLDRLGGQRLAIGPPQAQALGVGEVVRGHLARQVGARHAERPRGVVDLVVDVGDVGDERHLVALVLEEALEQRGDDVGPRVADMDAVVDRRPARIDAHAARVARLERLLAAGARVVQADLAGHRPPIYARCGRDGWPAPGRPGRVYKVPCHARRAAPRPAPRAARRGLPHAARALSRRSGGLRRHLPRPPGRRGPNVGGALHDPRGARAQGLHAARARRRHRHRRPDVAGPARGRAVGRRRLLAAPALRPRRRRPGDRLRGHVPPAQRAPAAGAHPRRRAPRPPGLDADDGRRPRRGLHPRPRRHQGLVLRHRGGAHARGLPRPRARPARLRRLVQAGRRRRTRRAGSPTPSSR